MDGTAELLQLAHLLRIGAETAEGIAKLRSKDASEIARLKLQLEAIAERFEEMTQQSNGYHPVAP